MIRLRITISAASLEVYGSSPAPGRIILRDFLVDLVEKLLNEEDYNLQEYSLNHCK